MTRAMAIAIFCVKTWSELGFKRVPVAVVWAKQGAVKRLFQ